jgi:hypothetical protein
MDMSQKDLQQHGKPSTAWIGVEDRGRYNGSTYILKNKVGSHDLICQAKLCRRKDINGGRLREKF